MYATCFLIPKETRRRHRTPLDLELQTVVSSYVATEIENISSGKVAGAFNLWAIFPASRAKILTWHTFELY